MQTRGLPVAGGGETCDIGNHVKLYQGVTLGALSFPTDSDGNLVRGAKRHPTLEDRVIIYANATILGGLTVIGHDSVIGSSVWLTRSVDPHTTVVLEKPKLRMRADQVDELRRDVLTALSSDAGAVGRLVDPPCLAEIQAALSSLDADALVYLVPADPPQPGFAVLAPAHGPARFLALPNLALDDQDVQRYLTALDHRT